MSDLALYRKYRPQAFKDVLGQEHIVAPLQEAVKNNTFAHAYLFSGSRGTGKTSIARLFAGAIGCAPEDIHEMDAASNRGIDDIRELRDAVRALPFRSPYKLYLIDEVHMLTKEAFNALLKTLEEPPAHAVFVLATTEPAKLPDTIVSRCQHFAFRKPSHAVLKKSAERIAKAEGRKLAPSAADIIAMLGDGSFRDMQGVLQKVLNSVSESDISREDVERLTAAPSSELVSLFLSALAEQDTERTLAAVSTAAEQSTDFKLFLKLILRNMRAILLLRFAKGIRDELARDMGEEEVSRLEALAGPSGKALNSAALKELLAAYSETERAYLPQLPLELAVLAITRAEESSNT